MAERRIDVIRHGERVDGYFEAHVCPNAKADGIKWWHWALDVDSNYKPLDENFPLFLPHRDAGILEYGRDCPLTRRGVRDAETMGRQMADEGRSYDLVFSSPALRSLQTAAALLKGMNSTQAIKVESGYLEYFFPNKVPPIIPLPHIKQRYDINVDLDYQPIFDYHTLRLESVEEFYQRSHDTTTHLLQRFPKEAKILIVAHSTSRDTIHRQLRGHEPLRSVPDFRAMLGSSSWHSYLAASAVELRSGRWELVPPVPQPTPELRAFPNNWQNLARPHFNLGD